MMHQTPVHVRISQSGLETHGAIAQVPQQGNSQIHVKNSTMIVMLDKPKDLAYSVRKIGFPGN
jgi:hypothetical protein